MEKKYRLLIEGKFVDSISGKEFTTYNPATGEKIADVAEGGTEDINRAVKAARQAFEEGPWHTMSPTERGKLLVKAGGIIRRKSKELAILDTLDAGKPINDTTSVDVPMSAEFFEYYGGLCDKICGETLPVGNDFLNYTRREPYGVVGLLTAWNFPILNAAIKIAPAIACGNCVILKASELTPLTALELGRACLEAGIPEGVVNVVPGFGKTAGEALVEHLDVDKIAFTGSCKTGRRIMQAASKTFKHVTLELGGKSPNVVFPDADIEAAIYGAIFGIFPNQGQECCASSRLFLHESIHDEFLERLIEKSRKIKVGNPLSEDTQLGAIISGKQLEKIKGYVASGLEEGASLKLGGRNPVGVEFKKGFFYLPTIFSDVKNDMKIAREEIFGPVLSVLKFRDEKEAVRLANETQYGLAAAIWTKDIKRAHLLAREIKAGSIYINDTTLFGWAAPFGGYKASGVGREMGMAAIDTYTQTKDVWVNLSPEPNRWADPLESK
ncbi:aldehyde dehydrogenase family protein [bacterium]|nr:aldehyde dehydrogenase family protein [bacterium]